MRIPRTGIVTGSTFAVPAVVPRAVKFTMDLSPIDRLNPLLSVRFWVERFVRGAWEFAGGFGEGRYWVGRALDLDHLGAPQEIGFGLVGLNGLDVRGMLDVPVLMDVGAFVEIV